MQLAEVTSCQYTDLGKSRIFECTYLKDTVETTQNSVPGQGNWAEFTTFSIVR